MKKVQFSEDALFTVKAKYQCGRGVSLKKFQKHLFKSLLGSNSVSTLRDIFDIAPFFPFLEHHEWRE